MVNYSELCVEVQKIARRVGDFIRGEAGQLLPEDIQLKERASLVTYVDRTAEALIVDALRNLLPTAGFVTEEGTAAYDNEELLWLVDPLDGTTNFVHGIYPCSVSIALAEKEKPVLGVVYEIGLNEMFYAWKGGAAYLNDEEIRVSQTANLENSLVGTGFPYYNFVRFDEYINVLKILMMQTHGLRRMGSAAVDLCYVATGRFDAFFEHALHSWDVAAGAFIAQQAGARVTDFDGGGNWLFNGEIVVGGENIFPDFFKLVNSCMGNSK
ncbi:MAG: inositol monophosphatase [Prolixibacteraceae bacterium]|nr:inositol monophosphatase [Prolixibacteraceae bacterium]